MRQLTKDLNNLKESDLINLMLYGIYKLSGNPEYNSLCELIYVLDKDSLYKLCSVYGGTTIKIPTMDELKQMINVLLIYQKVHEGLTFEEAYKEVDPLHDNTKDVFELYKAFSKLLDDYE